jgi:hypothetical protein
MTRRKWRDILTCQPPPIPPEDQREELTHE